MKKGPAGPLDAPRKGSAERNASRTTLHLRQEEGSPIKWPNDQSDAVPRHHIVAFLPCDVGGDEPEEGAARRMARTSMA